MLFPKPVSSGPPDDAVDWFERKSRWLLAALLTVSFGVRVWLAASGGQDFWPDEARYSSTAREGAALFQQGTPREAWAALIGKADHLFFKVAGLPVAWWEIRHGQNSVLVASYFGLFSVLSLWLIYGIARRAGANAREGLLALFFATGASSLFYYCRHFFPYDLSLFFGLLSLWLALGKPTWVGSLGAGLAAGFGFLSYNGYWLLAGVVLVWHVLAGRSFRLMMTRAFWGGIGLLAPIVTVVLAARWLGYDLIASFREFSATITQGDFGRGYLFVWQYLWDTEGVLFLAWSALVLAGLRRWRQSREVARVLLWLGVTLAIYLGLVACSDGLKTFVVYGRTARLLVPFLCLAAAAAGEEILSRRWCPRWMMGTVLTGMAVVAGLQMSRAIRQVFPEEFLVEAAQVARKTRASQPGLLRLLNAERLGEGRVMEESRPHLNLLVRKHPYEFRPYLYEGFVEAQRTAFRNADISMRLVAVPGLVSEHADAAASVAWRLRLRFPEHRDGVAEPLITGGTKGRANFLYVKYLDDSHVSFGYDVWGDVPRVTPPVKLNYRAEHKLVLVCGKLGVHPGRDEGTQEASDLLVVCDGKVLLSERGMSNVVDPATVFVGLNFAGGSSARTCFSGDILSLEKLRDAEARPFLAQRSLRGLRPEPAWGGYPGPLELHLAQWPGVGLSTVPLLTSGTDEAYDRLFLTRSANGVVRLGFQHSPEPAVYSEPVTPSELQTFEVAMGSCIPPDELTAAEPPLWPKWLGNRVNVSSGGHLVLRWVGPFHPTTPKKIILGGNALDADGEFTEQPGADVQAEQLEMAQLSAAAGMIKSVDRQAEQWNNYPGPLRLRVRIAARPAGTNEPLIVSGVTGAGDFIFLRHQGNGRVALGHDHWKAGGIVSADVPVADGTEHELIVSLGSLFPPDDNALCYRQEPDWKKLRDQRIVLLDGKTLLSGSMAAHPSRPEQIYAGMNPIGGSSADRLFTGEILSIERAPLKTLEAFLSGETPGASPEKAVQTQHP